MSKQFILLVEDDEVMRRAIERALSNIGHMIRAASTYDEGLRIALCAEPALLVLDIELPGGSGWSLLKAMHVRSGGVAKFVPKPFDMAYLIETVREVLALPR